MRVLLSYLAHGIDYSRVIEALSFFPVSTEDKFIEKPLSILWYSVVISGLRGRKEVLENLPALYENTWRK